MSNRELVVLGTASQAPTRYRSHNSFVLRWDEQLILFDPGEGTQRQFIFANLSVARLTAVCITHFHGDHSLGLSGIIQRRALDSRSGTRVLPPLPVYFPADGVEYFERLRSSSIFHDTSKVVPKPIAVAGTVDAIGPLTLSAAPLDHRVTTLGYRLSEADGRRVDPAALDRHGIVGPDVGLLLDAGWIQTDDGVVTVDEVTLPRPGQSFAFVMDTAPCTNAVTLARNVDLMVAESTYLESEADLAADYGHLTAAQAADIAVQAGARRLVLGHFSSRYTDATRFAVEAGAIHPDVVVAEDLTVVSVPGRPVDEVATE